MWGDLSGQRALITGASDGLGLYLAEVLARAGAEVVLAARREERLRDAVAKLRQQGWLAQAVAMDVTSSESITEAMAKAATASITPLTILVNNAGIAAPSAALSIAEEDWDRVLDTNLKGAFLVAQAFARHLCDAGQPGGIVNIASILGERVGAEVASYCASKAALIHLTKALALEWAKYDIRVNAIAPGYISTEMNREFFATPAGEKLIARIPQRRLGLPEDLAGPLLLLVSTAGRYMTGAVLAVDGGHLCSTL